MTWIFAGAIWFMVAEARGKAQMKETWFVLTALTVVFATAIYHIVLTVRLKRAKSAVQ